MRICVAVIAALPFLAPAFAGPIFLVVPTANTSTPGAPDSLDGTGDVRFQQVYGRGQFLSSGISGPVLISQFAMRAFPDTGPASITPTSVDIYASTTWSAPNNASGNTLITGTFATNLGPDNSLVFSGPLALSSPGCAGPSACPFDMVVTFDSPFLYNPTQGFLLLDFHFFGFSGDGFVDHRNFPFPPGGPIASVDGLLGDPTGEVFTEGVITRFTYEAVPEPASGMLLLAGLGTLLALRRRAVRNKA